MSKQMPTLKDVNLERFYGWLYHFLTEEAMSSTHEDEIAEALGIEYDTSMPEPEDDATEEDWINYNNFYDEQNDNIYDLFYQALGEIMPDPSLKNKE